MTSSDKNLCNTAKTDGLWRTKTYADRTAIMSASSLSLKRGRNLSNYTTFQKNVGLYNRLN